MPKPFSIPVYKTAAFIRLLLPFLVGILLQWYLQLPLPVIVMAIIGFAAANLLFYFLPLALRFKLQVPQGILINLLLLTFGLIITWQ